MLIWLFRLIHFYKLQNFVSCSSSFFHTSLLAIHCSLNFMFLWFSLCQFQAANKKKKTLIKYTHVPIDIDTINRIKLSFCWLDIPRHFFTHFLFNYSICHLLLLLLFSAHYDTCRSVSDSYGKSNTHTFRNYFLSLLLLLPHLLCLFRFHFDFFPFHLIAAVSNNFTFRAANIK